MASKKKATTETSVTIKTNAPQTLKDSVFFKRLGFSLTPEQIAFRDAIYDKNTDIIFCNAKAGTGKSTVAVSTAMCMIEYGLYDKLIYCFSPVNFQNSIGLLPGTVEEKVAPFMEPLYEALVECGYMPEKIIKQLAMDSGKESDILVDCVPHTFMRGTNIDSRSILIIDEAQNFFADELKKVLTRVKGGKTIVIGHDKQCDLYKESWNSGFIAYLNHFKDHEKVKICELTENHRGWVSQWADELNITRH